MHTLPELPVDMQRQIIRMSVEQRRDTSSEEATPAHHYCRTMKTMRLVSQAWKDAAEQVMLGMVNEEARDRYFQSLLYTYRKSGNKCDVRYAVSNMSGCSLYASSDAPYVCYRCGARKRVLMDDRCCMKLRKRVRAVLFSSLVVATTLVCLSLRLPPPSFAVR